MKFDLIHKQPPPLKEGKAPHPMRPQQLPREPIDPPITGRMWAGAGIEIVTFFVAAPFFAAAALPVIAMLSAIGGLIALLVYILYRLIF